ncbi:MAG TPA: arginase [Vicinamibacteria bacterium]|nr:arginase [Vicinamibacteria bacterium]
MTKLMTARTFRSRVHLIGVPLDLGAGRRGVDMGPSALRIAGVSKVLEGLGYQVVDDGDITVTCPEVQGMTDAKLKYLPEIVRTVSLLCEKVQQSMARGEIPLVLGGDHSMAIGTISGVSTHYRQEGKKLGLLWFDAHGDANTPETTPSGNIHGMPLAVVLGRGAKELVEVGGFASNESRVDPDRVVLIGVRSIDECERGVLKELGIVVFTMENIDRRGIHAVTKEAIEIASAGTEAFHVSFDVDVLDPSVATGVGTPSRGGLTYREAHTAMELVAESGKLCSLEMAEVNPVLDVRNSTAEVAVELIGSALGKRII